MSYPKKYVMKKLGFLLCTMIAFQMALQAQNKEHADHLSFPEYKNFTGISIALAANLYLRQSDSFSVRVEGDAEILDRLIVRLKDSTTLHFSTEQYRFLYKDFERIRIYISAPNFEYLSFSGFGKVISDNTLKGSKLTIRHNGAHNIDLTVDYASIDASMSGAGNITLEGKAQNCNFEMNGTGTIDAYDLKVQEARCLVSGLGSISCYVENDLDARVSGLGSIKYKGYPKQLRKSVSGLGKVIGK
jgi:Putative auto-transporter adhesin, head GIN domain